MEYSCIGLNDLPDEILMIIFKKLNNFDILYSFQGVNQRLNKIIQDPIFISHLTFVKWLSHNFIDLFCCDMIRNRFCLQILPLIRRKIQWLDLESSSMKYVLNAVDYPNLHTLGLYNINEESARCLCTDKKLSSDIFEDQIRRLFITIDNNNITKLTIINILNYMLTVFTNLICLTLYESSYRNRVLLCFDDLPPTTFRSSTLLKLNIRVQWFKDCLYILDGRFSQLHTLNVDMGDLPNLKYFSLSSEHLTYDYNKTILPLLNRMSNLEELGLYLTVYVNETFIDGNHLKKNIINRMSRLNQFRFSINSIMCINNPIYFPTTEDIQETFIHFPNGIISYVDYLSEFRLCLCHIYSYPSLMPYYSDITNNFPGGLFEYVRAVSLCDDAPFEHEFFIQIQKSFPFLERLSVINHKSQNRKQSYEFNNDNQNLSPIKYLFLNVINLFSAHDDYVEQFLLNTRTSLPNNVSLYINYKSLERVTHNFTRDATRINSTKISYLNLRAQNEYFNVSLKEYFPHAKIFSSIMPWIPEQ
ncbi:unnamed protein product [Rotaria sordida]|uniref:F-box domain-containing protein n=1 Tax=Rotaria sordida TaxID=392033 RepID=A0A819X4P8_9BILA|nr:unnamed protein product [Rotaria sordida]CAF4099320.1 unnamed protein product [Rotaria sordida]CAF4135070.1 unnamed protein product [Rotaria sordida]